MRQSERVCRILVVDDDPEVSDRLTTHLTGQGYEVTAQADADKALRAVRRDRPVLVLLGLPDRNGLDVLRRVQRRVRRRGRGIGVIVMTGDDDVAQAQSALQLGALDCLFKPFDLDRLDRSVRVSLDEAEPGRCDQAEATVSQIRDVTVVAPEGDLDTNAANRIRRTLLDLIEQGRSKLIVDLRTVDYIDSSGLGALVTAMKRARAAGGDLQLANPRESVRSILEMTGLRDHIAVHANRTEAVVSFS